MEKNALQKLIFIYNADTGFRNRVIDEVHKILSPKTYSCNLCRLTYGAFSEKYSWKNFQETLEIEIEFLHKNEFQKMYASKFGFKYEFPIILSASKDELEVFIGTQELNTIVKVDDLIKLIVERLGP